ncbi:uncharacterized protein MEPE_03644 [Melanopsichium pennsylvanicum]|uniref:CREG-like beta-barrel domain-containing protein n=2 Tax=Melanopsichium pennsylvanicum TaxID=63383 RepID=A0AAJ4XLT5_9BASI|nr:conserved hypothetical protein [Melanopsichium pennsylvanicum 4]SNX84935.1 uncharacterized protein MEPE_03644 [Melanopsichium pennsylvanicum]
MLSQLVKRLIHAAALLCALGTTKSLAWETKAQALEQAVRLVHDPLVFGVSTLSTKYPADHPVTELAGHVITGPEYFAPWNDNDGTLLYLGLTVSQTWRNVLRSDFKNATVSIASNANPAIPDPRHTSRHHHHWEKDRPSWRRGMPSKSRVTLFGHFTILNFTEHPEQVQKASSCYLDYHPDASHWALNSTESPHIPFWAIFNVDKVYWVGGFGDEHYIGWFNKDEWNSAWKEHSNSTQEGTSDLTMSSSANGISERLLAIQYPISPSQVADGPAQNSHTLAFQ